MPQKIYAASCGEPGFVRVTNVSGNAGIRMPVLDLIKGLAQRGRVRS